MAKIKDFEEGRKAFERHDPVSCNGNLVDNIKIYSAIKEISNVVSDNELSYEEFLTAVGMLSHYYDNWFEINDFDLDDEEDMEFITLPNVYDGVIDF